MSVITSGAFVLQVAGCGLIGLILVILGALWTGRFRTPRTLHRTDLSASWVEGVFRFLSEFGTPSSPRAPPGYKRGDRVPVRVTLSETRRRERNDRLS